jgi:very-short-patch-repair endonuclease
MTKSEACLWKYALKAKQTGYTFNRQRPVLNYIADFMCKPLKLIIEVDGITHLSEEAQVKDAKRQKDLEAAGFKVIRFTSKQVLTDIGGVIDVISDSIKSLEQIKNSVSSPCPLGEGDNFSLEKKVHVNKKDLV